VVPDSSSSNRQARRRIRQIKAAVKTRARAVVLVQVVVVVVVRGLVEGAGQLKEETIDHSRKPTMQHRIIRERKVEEITRDPSRLSKVQAKRDEVDNNNNNNNSNNAADVVEVEVVVLNDKHGLDHDQLGRVVVVRLTARRIYHLEIRKKQHQRTTTG
jgi:hypothetical protein